MSDQFWLTKAQLNRIKPFAHTRSLRYAIAGTASNGLTVTAWSSRQTSINCSSAPISRILTILRKAEYGLSRPGA
jgi:hypothetical protein